MKISGAQLVQLVQNMGWRYVSFRARHELLRRSGMLKKRFPVSPAFRIFITLSDWQQKAPAFFFTSKKDIGISRKPDNTLHLHAREICSGRFRFFNAPTTIDLGTGDNWLTNPSNGYRYDNQKHWTDIPDFSAQTGDIKYVWEKSRFSWLYTLIRDDYHNDADHGEYVFAAIDSWIDKNPVNQGPNWRCSQEISLRVLNWTFALYYYRFHPALTQNRFERIIHSVYWQLRHVYHNIHFSRIAVRNNHAITETLMLYLGGLIFPFFPEAVKWKKAGKAWFETEILYQIYPDGAYLQHSFNYQRVVVQLLTWATILAKKHGEHFTDTLIKRAQKTLAFMLNFQFGEAGEMPNYGSNDGALFFPLSSCDYTDFRPQLNALHVALYQTYAFKQGPWTEESWWYGLSSSETPKSPYSYTESPLSFSDGGYYSYSTPRTRFLIRCCSYRDRPAQADNLHFDLWLDGRNLLRDAGTYRYNTAPQIQAKFSGTAAHNTAALGDYDQMKKGSRFIWFFWTKALSAKWKETSEWWEFEGVIQAFEHVEKGIQHRRTVRQHKQHLLWEVEDHIIHGTDLPLRQFWHPHPEFLHKLSFTAVDQNGSPLPIQQKERWYSAYYGIKEEAPMLVFSSETNTITTKIQFIP